MCYKNWTWLSKELVTRSTILGKSNSTTAIRRKTETKQGQQAHEQPKIYSSIEQTKPRISRQASGPRTEGKATSKSSSISQELSIQTEARSPIWLQTTQRYRIAQTITSIRYSARLSRPNMIRPGARQTRARSSIASSHSGNKALLQQPTIHLGSTTAKTQWTLQSSTQVAAR